MDPALPDEPGIAGRRTFLKLFGLGGLPLLTHRDAFDAVSALMLPPGAPSARVTTSVYERMLGVRPFINAAGPITALGGTLMPGQVVKAMRAAAQHFVDMNELNRAAGVYLAGILKAEAAMVTSGAFGAMVLGAAACLTEDDPEKIAALPHPTWPRREVVLQRAHSTGYDRAYRNAGMTIIYVDTEEEMLAALGERTAMIAGLIRVEKMDFPKLIPLERLIAIGRRAGVPVYLDASWAANQVPPLSNLWRYTEMGADLVGISGGKGLRGPQSSGILAGRADLIAAARAHASPNATSLGRGMKVDKEEIVGLLAAVERFIALDHDAVMRRRRKRVDTMRERLQGISGVRLGYDESFFGPGLVLSWAEPDIALSYEEFTQRMRDGDPSVAVTVLTGPSVLFAKAGGPTLFTAYLKEGEEKVVAHRAREVLVTARS